MPGIVQERVGIWMERYTFIWAISVTHTNNIRLEWNWDEQKAYTVAVFVKESLASVIAESVFLLLQEVKAAMCNCK